MYESALGLPTLPVWLWFYVIYIYIYIYTLGANSLYMIPTAIEMMTMYILN